MYFFICVSIRILLQNLKFLSKAQNQLSVSRTTAGLFPLILLSFGLTVSFIAHVKSRDGAFI